MAAIVGDVNGRPGGPGRGLLQVGAGKGVARLILLQDGRMKTLGLILLQKTELSYLSFLNCEFNHKGMFFFFDPEF